MSVAASESAQDARKGACIEAMRISQSEAAMRFAAIRRSGERME